MVDCRISHFSSLISHLNLAHPILQAVLSHPLDTLRIEVIPKHITPLLCRRNRKRSYASHHVRDDLSGSEERDETFVFVVQAGVPVDVSEIEGEGAGGLVLSR
jgi:hypothetical protein